MQRINHRADLRFVVVAVLAALFMLSHREALAQAQTPAQQKCTNAVNKDLTKVDKTLTKQITACLKNHAKGKPLNKGNPAITTLEQCIGYDPRGKVAKAKTKTNDDFLKKCTGQDRGGVDKLSPYGVTSAALVNEIATLKEANLVHDTFGVRSGLRRSGDDRAFRSCPGYAIRGLTSGTTRESSPEKVGRRRLPGL